MKLATYQDGSRDGQLVVVSRDLTTAHFATGIAGRLQAVLDDWNYLSPQLEDLYAALNGGKARHAFAFDARLCMAPLPRAWQWVDGSAYPTHLNRLRQASGAGTPPAPATELRMRRGGSDHFLGPREPARFADPPPGIDFEAQLAVITGDVAMGATAGAALEGVRLLMLANAWILRDPAPDPIAKGGAVLPSPAATAFGPVALTPDELGEAWRRGRVHGTLQLRWNGKSVGLVETGADMDFHFGQLIAELAKTRRVGAGSIVGGGPVSNEDAARGCACIAEKRALESLDGGAPKTGFMQFGDTLRIELKLRDGSSPFGSIEQTVSAA